MTAELYTLSCITSLDIPPDRVLEAAKGILDGVMVIGFTKDGDLYTASSYADGGTALWLLEQTKQRVLNPSAD